MVFLNNSFILYVLDVGMMYFLFANGTYFLLLAVGAIDVELQRRTRKSERPLSDAHYPLVSIIAPAFNMENSILGSAGGMLKLDYPDYEVILVNDGSSDRTLELLKTAYELVPEPFDSTFEVGVIRGLYRSQKNPRLRVLDKNNRGSKADALNAGISFARHALFCAVDADSLLEQNSLRRIVRPFVLDPERTVAVGGTVRVMRGESQFDKNPLVLFQTIEYLRAFYGGRTGWNRFNALLIISGAFGVFKTQAVKDVGGYDVTAIGEDLELVLRLHAYFRSKRIKYKIKFAPEATCWTEVPSTIQGLYTQRNRWQRGLIDSLIKNWGMAFNSKAGAIGVFAIPYFIFVELIGPIVEIWVWLLLIVAQHRHMLNNVFWWKLVVVSLLVSWIISFCSVALERVYFSRYWKTRDYILLFFGSIFEPFGYRQLLAVWRFLGFFDWMRGNKNWGILKRRGFGPT